MGQSPRMLLLSSQLAPSSNFSPLMKIQQATNHSGPPFLFLRGGRSWHQHTGGASSWGRTSYRHKGGVGTRPWCCWGGGGHKVDVSVQVGSVLPDVRNGLSFRNTLFTLLVPSHMGKYFWWVRVAHHSLCSPVLLLPLGVPRMPARACFTQSLTQESEGCRGSQSVAHQSCTTCSGYFVFHVLFVQCAKGNET